MPSSGQMVVNSLDREQFELGNSLFSPLPSHEPALVLESVSPRHLAVRVSLASHLKYPPLGLVRWT